MENMVEEMAEETKTETYNNYKFLTAPELKELSLAHLVGKTSLLRPYMHGYFVASKLHDQARLIANPYVWEEERMKRVKEKVDKERATRIRGHKKVKVNQKFVDKLLKKQENRDKVDPEAGFLGDERFRSLFEDEEFLVDETSAVFRALNPGTAVEEPEQDKRGLGGNESHSGAEGGSDDGHPIRKRDKDVVMRVSSSSQQGSRSKDSALGSRTQRSRRVSKVRQGAVVGERQITFVPESKKQERHSPQQTTKRKDSRRSASANTFRRL